MSFLARHENQEDPSQSGDVEELYEKLFAKIGRDFVYKEDYEEVIAQLQELIAALSPLVNQSPISFKSDAKARLKAAEYKQVIESGKDGSKIYKDLVSIDTDDSEES